MGARWTETPTDVDGNAFRGIVFALLLMAPLWALAVVVLAVT